MNQATIDFIRQHQEEDVRQLAFLGNKYPEVDMPFALDQIRGRQMARTKLPRWASIDGIIYPPHISMEQCSSEATAQYKAELAARWLNVKNGKIPSLENGDMSENCEFASESTDALKFAKNDDTSEKQGKVSFLDMTGGFGVDFSYIAAQLGMKAIYVERQEHLCKAAKENFERLGLRNAEVMNGDGIEMLHSLSRLSLIFIDPARRDDAGNKVVSLQDCTPDVTQLQDEMLAKADFVIIKLSPMLDWHRAVSELKHVREVHIVSTGNECKELLLVLSKHARTFASPSSSAESEVSAHLQEPSLKIYCVNDEQVMSYDEGDESQVSLMQVDDMRQTDELTANGYLYEPNASLMKAGCFGVISSRYGVKMLAKNSHLFVSDKLINDFPGRSFRIRSISSFNKKELKRQLSGITKANIAIRNFPLSVAELRKRLKLKDGGDTYVFATTLSDESHVLFICDKQEL